MTPAELAATIAALKRQLTKALGELRPPQVADINYRINVRSVIRYEPRT